MIDRGDWAEAFAHAVQRSDSPLYRSWADEATRDLRYCLPVFDAYSADVPTVWGAVQQLTRATSVQVRRHPDQALAEYFPVLGGNRAPDRRSFELWTELLRDSRVAIRQELQAGPIPRNDPAAGTRMLGLLGRYLREFTDESLGLELLAVGAAAGLELVADLIEPELLRPHQVLSRRGVDLHPLNPADPDTVQRMLGLLEPEQVDAQRRILRAARVAVEHGIVVSRLDAFEVVSAPGFGFGRLPVVFGSSFLCSVPDPQRMPEVMRSRYAEGIWIADEAAGVLDRVVDDPVVHEADPEATVTRLVHYRAGEPFATRTLDNR